MRQWSKSNVASLDNPSVLRDLIQKQDIQLHELSAAVGLLGQNRRPTATNNILVQGVTDHGQLTGLADDDHTQYLLLAGRSGGAAVLGFNSATVPLTIKGAASQSVDYFDIKNSADSRVVSVNTSGHVVIGDPIVSGETLTLSADAVTQANNLTTDPLNITPSVLSGVVIGRAAAGPRVYVNPALGFPTMGGQTWQIALRAEHASPTQAAVIISNSGAGTGPLTVWQFPEGTSIAQITSAGYFRTPRLELTDATGDIVSLSAASASTAHALTLPAAQGAANSLLQNDGSGGLTWTTSPTLDSLSVGGGQFTLNSAGELTSYLFFNNGTGDGYIDFTNITGSGNLYVFPDGGGAILSTNSTATVNSKTLSTSTNIRCNTAAGTTFQDNSSTTKQMRFNLSGITAGNTRHMKWHDVAGTVVLVGNTTSAAGVLGLSSLTAQTGSIGATTLLTGGTSSAGMYRVSVYMTTTTAGGGGATVKATVAWNDGAAQTLDVPLLTAAGVGATLDLTTVNAHGQGSVIVYTAASQNITYTTTFTAGTGSPQYSIYVRIEALG